MGKQIYDLRLNNIVSELSGLRRTDLETLAQQLCVMLSEPSEPDTSVYSLNRSTTKPTCKKCGSLSVSKYGKTAKGHQRYRCLDCGSVFTSISDTLFSGSQKDAKQWSDFIFYTLEGRSLRFCAEKCNISLPTSFAWRHKLLNALTSQQFSNNLTGLVEVDEMFVNVSYKGNHKLSKNFTMPRPAYKRGTDNHSRYPRDKACVLCVAERNSNFSGIVTHRGPLTTAILSQVFDGRISNDTVVITDESKALNKYFQPQTYAHIAVAASVTGSIFKTVPVVKGTYHINNINALHSRFRDFLRQFNGVSTKHLNSYLSLFLWLENKTEKNNLSADDTIHFALNNSTHMTYKEVTALPMPLAS